MRLLLVEDDHKTAAILKKGLQEEDFVVDVVYHGDEVLAVAEATEYELIILDWLLPGRSGIDICRELRERGATVPILMLTARDAVEDRVTGLNTGADDYLIKPYAFWELLARIHALLRRAKPSHLPEIVVADLRLDPVSHRVTREGKSIDLTAKQYAILEVLARHAGEVVTRTRIAEHVWEDDFDNLTNLLDVHISHLRKKLETDSGPELIHTIRGRGYRFGPPAP